MSRKCGWCSGKPAAVHNPRLGVAGQWTVIYPHKAMRTWPKEADARAFMASRSDPERYTLVDPEGRHVPYPPASPE